MPKTTKNNKKVSAVNRVTIRGVIVNLFKSENFCSTTIRTAQSRDTVDYPRILWYGESANMVAENFKEGDRVTILGQVQTSRKYRTQYISGTNIELTNRELKEKVGIDTGRYLIDQNEVLLVGDFLRSYVPEGKENLISIVTLRVTKDGHTNFPQVTCFGNVRESVGKMQQGDPVCFVGHVETSRKETDDGTKYFQSIVSYYATPAEAEQTA